jgi:hypothetical protein
LTSCPTNCLCTRTIIRLELSGTSEIDCNNPYVITQTNQGQKGIFVLNTPVLNMSPEIIAEIDGPCGPISQSFDNLDAVGTMAGEIDFDLGGNFVRGQFIGSNYKRLAVGTRNNPPDALMQQVLGPIENAVADQEFNKLIGTAQSRGHWSMLGLSARYLQTMTGGNLPIAYAEGLAGVSGFVAVVRRKG